jgi:hypothetical protein
MPAPIRQVAVCPDCASQHSLDVDHRCSAQGQRIAAETLDEFIHDAEKIADVYTSAPSLGFSGAGLLWLYRVAYRIRQKMNGMERYGDRAALARRVCGLGGELVQ